MANWFDQLAQASLNGVPFAVNANKGQFGREIAVHKYPKRDDVWPEDMGRAARRFNVTAFVIEDDVVFNGGSSIAQRDALIAQAEAPGPKTLVHPTYGKRSVVVMKMEVGDTKEEGRVFTIQFEFIEAGKKIFPKTTTNTTKATQLACVTANVAATINFVRVVKVLLAGGVGVVAQAQAQVANVVGQVATLSADATSAMHLVALLTTGLSPSSAGMFGRFAGGALTNSSGISQVSSAPDATVASAIALGAASRAAISSAGSALVGVAATLSAAAPDGYATSVQTYVQSLQNAMVDPADAVRVLTALAGYGPIQANAVPVPWAPAAAMQSAANDVFRRAAVVSLANASSLYQPSSSNDAYTLMSTVVRLLDVEANIAGDQGADETFNAFEALSAAVVADLTARGAALPDIRLFSINASLPAAVIAQRLYKDPSRADELVAEANAIHPAFMPLSFQVLSS